MSDIYNALKKSGHTVLDAGAPALTPVKRGSGALTSPLPLDSKVWPENAALFYKINSLRVANGSVALQFVSSRPREGTTTVATQFAQFAAFEDGGAVLMVDCASPRRRDRDALDRPNRPTLAEAFATGGSIDQAISREGASANLHTALLSDTPNSTLHVNADALAAVIDQARERYRFTVLDTPSLLEAPDSVVFSRACDGVILVIEAEATRAPVVESTINDIEMAGGKILGFVFNKRRFHIPEWLYRRL